MKTFKTSNLALCGYLEMNGLKPIGEEVIKDNRGKTKVEFIFEDKDGHGLDLELEFRHSPEKKYRDLLFIYRKKISELLKETHDEI